MHWSVRIGEWVADSQMAERLEAWLSSWRCCPSGAWLAPRIGVLGSLTTPHPFPQWRGELCQTTVATAVGPVWLQGRWVMVTGRSGWRRLSCVVGNELVVVNRFRELDPLSVQVVSEHGWLDRRCCLGNV